MPAEELVDLPGVAVAGDEVPALVDEPLSAELVQQLLCLVEGDGVLEFGACEESGVGVLDGEAGGGAVADADRRGAGSIPGRGW